MTKLTNNDRDIFVRTVLDDVPRIDYQELARAAIQKWAIAQLPPKLRALHKEFSHYFATKTVYRLPGNFSCVVAVAIENIDEAMRADTVFWGSIVDLATAASAQCDRVDTLRAKIKAVIYACTTDKQARERLPEFADYLPSDTPTVDRSVPVIANLVADLTAAGWPKKKAKAKPKNT
jgi:hypothetical protein